MVDYLSFLVQCAFSSVSSWSSRKYVLLNPWLCLMAPANSFPCLWQFTAAAAGIAPWSQGSQMFLPGVFQLFLLSSHQHLCYSFNGMVHYRCTSSTNKPESWVTTCSSFESLSEKKLWDLNLRNSARFLKYVFAGHSGSWPIFFGKMPSNQKSGNWNWNWDLSTEFVNQNQLSSE